MKLFTAIALATLCLFLTACNLTPGQAEQGLGTVVRAVDRDGDGIVTNQEIRKAPNDPMAWIAGILGILGVLGGGAAAVGNRKTAGEVDELWDRTHAAPVVTAKLS